MIVTVKGCKNQTVEEELIKASNFFAKELLSKKMLPHIVLEIVMKTTIKDLGTCECTFTNDWYRPREFEIQLRRHRSLRNTLLTLAHEMVHLKQFAKGELKTDHSKWKNTPINTEEIEYHLLPWEVEATSKEFVLYAMYQEQL